MKQFAVIGLGVFGRRVVDELCQLNVEILVVDQDEKLIEQYIDRVSSSYVANALHEDVIRKLIPSNIDGVVIDLGGRVEVSALVTNYLKKMKIRNIIARAESDEHGEVLSLLGATQVIFPNREAAKRVTPLLVSADFYNFFPISDGLVMAEVRIPPELVNKTLAETDFRRSYLLNVVAVRDAVGAPFHFVSGDFVMGETTNLLVVGDQSHVVRFCGLNPSAITGKGSFSWKSLFGIKSGTKKKRVR